MKRLILSGLLLITGHAFADSAAKVLFTLNKVTLSHNGAERTLARGATLDPGDQISTSAGAAVHLQYSNGSLVNLGSNTTYKILAYSPKADVQINAELSKGKAEIENPGTIKETLKTPIVSLAILGTHINIDVVSPKITYIQVIEGLVLARNEYLRSGDSVRVTGDRIVNAPFPKDGLVNSPLNTAGKIESEDNPISDESISSGSSSAATIVTFETTNQVVGGSTTSGTSALQGSSSLAAISLVCNP